MSEHDSIARRLAQLAAPSRRSASGERLLTGPGLDPLAALLAEIDETILPRRLDFAADTGVHLACAARGGRLLALLPPAPDGLPRPAAALFGQPLTAEAADRLRPVFDAFVAGTTDITVRGTRRPDLPGPAVAGIAASALAAAWGLDLAAAPKPADPLAALQRDLSGIASAWVRLDAGRPTGAGGEPQAQAHLAAVAADHRGDPGDGLPRCLILGRQDRLGAVLIADAGDRRLLMLLPPRAVSRVAAVWRQALG